MPAAPPSSASEPIVPRFCNRLLPRSTLSSTLSSTQPDRPADLDGGVYCSTATREGRNSMIEKILMSLGVVALLASGQTPPRYQVDATWPKDLPEDWVFARLGGVCVDSHDHVAVVDRRDITKEEAETSHHAPPIVIFDRAGTVIQSIGDPNVVPASIHGCIFDKENNIWVGGNDDGIIQKYSHDGKLLMQIGKRGVFDTADGLRNGKRLNASHEQFFLPAGIAI